MLPAGTTDQQPAAAARRAGGRRRRHRGRLERSHRCVGGAVGAARARDAGHGVFARRARRGKRADGGDGHGPGKYPGTGIPDGPGLWRSGQRRLDPGRRQFGGERVLRRSRRDRRKDGRGHRRRARCGRSLRAILGRGDIGGAYARAGVCVHAGRFPAERAPKTYVLALAGVAILSSLQDALEKAFGGKMRFGALVAFAAAATPFAILGVSSAFWAIFAGILASALAERQQLVEFWNEGRESTNRG